MNRFFRSHPSEERLLRYLDQELPERASRHIGQHLDSCAECRGLTHDIERAAAEFERFHEQAIQRRMPEKIQPWADLRVDMTVFDLTHPRRTSWQPRWRTARRWVLATALLAGTALGVVGVIHRERNTPPPPPAPTRRQPLETPPPPAASKPAGAKNENPASSAVPPAPSRTLADTEVRVFAALHSIGADLDDPIEVAASVGGQVDVTGLSIPERRQAEVREALAPVAGVVVRFSAAGPLSAPPATAHDASPAKPSFGPFEATLAQHLGGRRAVELFSNRLLDESDAMMARAQAIHNLQIHFPQPRRAELHEVEQALLDDLSASHQVAFRRHARNLIRLLGEVRQAFGAGPAVDAGTAPLDPLGAARRMDRVLNLIFGGAASAESPSALAAELAAATGALQAAAGEAQ